MKKSFAFFLMLFAIVIGCTKSPETPGQADESTPKTVSIKGTITNPIGGKVTIATNTFPVQDYKRLVEIEVDSAGNFEAEFEIEGPLEASFSYSREASSCFLMPGYDLTVTLDTDAYDESINYAGKGAALNNFLAKKYLEEEAVRGDYNSDLMAKEHDDFMASLKSMKEGHLTALAGANLSEFERDYASARIEFEYLYDLGKYPGFYNYYNEKEAELPETYHEYWAKINWLSDDMLNLSEVYRGMVYNYAMKLVKDKKGDDFETYSVEGMNEILKAADQLPGLQKDYVKSKALAELISYFGIDAAEKQMAAYLAATPKVEWKESVTALYDKWQPLAQGNPAPNFEYKNLDGETISLASLKGKVVYVDIWATWCGPCKREIPSAKEVKKKMKGKEVEFLYVSVDDDLEAWKSFLADDPSFAQAIHTATRTGWKSEITENYLIDGIPRYLLIDKEGNIISANAPRPSSDDIQPLIEKALEA